MRRHHPIRSIVLYVLAVISQETCEARKAFDSTRPAVTGELLTAPAPEAS